MKIVHVDLIDQFNDDWSYQDNLLSRMHVRMGHDVTLITTCKKFDASGLIVTVTPDRYTLPDGVKVIRLPKYKRFLIKKLQDIYEPYPLYKELIQIKPDLIMVHGLTAKYANRDVIKYIKKVNPRCVLVTDNHNCEINTDVHLAKTIRQKLIFLLTKSMRKPLYPYSKKIFGITPACIDYMIRYYRAPKEKTELLPLGYDPDLIVWEKRGDMRVEFREKYGIARDDFLIVHGGKIIRRRKTPETIEAVMRLDDPKIKLVIFGGIDEEMK